MDKDIKLSCEQKEKLKEFLAHSKTGDKSSVGEIGNILTEEQAATVKNILADKNKLTEILSSPLAKTLMEKLGGRKED